MAEVLQSELKQAYKEVLCAMRSRHVHIWDDPEVWLLGLKALMTKETWQEVQNETQEYSSCQQTAQIP